MEAITGRRVFLFRDFIRIRAAENIVNSYISRKASQNWAQWSTDNPRMAKIIFEVEKILED